MILRGISIGNFTAENAETAEKNKNSKSETLKPKQTLITKAQNPKRMANSTEILHLKNDMVRVELGTRGNNMMREIVCGKRQDWLFWAL